MVSSYRVNPLGGVPTIDESAGSWVSRNTVPDMMPRADRPTVGGDCCDVPQSVQLYEAFDITRPGERPRVMQRGASLGLTVPPAGQAVALTANRFECDSMLLDVPSTVGNSLFFGYGGGVNSGNGIELQPGNPVIVIPDNTRELWELQRTLEYIANMLAQDRGLPQLPPYRAQRVCFNAAEWFVAAAAAIATPTAMTILLFHIPELQ